jgi:hypothetical protein
VRRSRRPVPRDDEGGGDSRGMERAAGSTDSARKEPVARSLRAAIQAEHHLQGEATR